MAKENTGDGRGGIDTMPCTKRRTVQPPHSTRRLPTLAMLTRPTAAPAFLPPLLLQTFAYGVKHAEVRAAFQMPLLHPLLLLLSRCTSTQCAAAAATVCHCPILASCAQHCRPELRLSEGP